MKLAPTKSALFVLTTLMIAASMILAACGTPAEEPSAPAPTEAPTTEPSQPQNIFEERFADNSNNWDIGAKENSQSAIEDGKLKVTSQPLDPAVRTYFSLPISVEEADLSVETEFTEGAPQNIYYGVACQYKDDNNYTGVFIFPDGYYGISRIVNGGTVNLTGKTQSALVNQGIGAVNHLRAICREGHVTLFINDTLAADVVDPSPLSGGSFRLLVNASMTSETDTNPVGVNFANLVVQEPLAWEPPTGILLSDSFDNNDRGWKLAEGEGGNSQIQDGQMVLAVTNPNWSYNVGLVTQFSNVDLSFDAAVKDGTSSNAYFGAMCRWSNSNNYYVFQVNESDFQLRKKVNGTFETLIHWTTSSAIKTGPGETNRIRVVCSGSDLELYANGQLLIKTQDTSLSSGGTILLAGRYSEDDASISVAFDNLEMMYASEPEPFTGLLLSDSFDNNNNNWSLFDEAGGSAQILDGQMVMNVKEADSSYRISPQIQLSKVDLSFDVTLQEGTPANASFGAMCRRRNADNYYDFIINEGSYMLGKMVDGTWDTLVEFTESAAIKQGIGETNQLRVVCSGSDLELYANGQQLIKTKDTSLAAGSFFLRTGRYTLDNNPVAVAFDNVEVKPMLDPPAEILLADSFSDNDHGWSFVEDENGGVRMQDGQLIYEIKNKQIWYWSMQQVSSSDVDISFDAIIQEGTLENAGFGATCRLVDENNYYDFIITGNGSYRLDKMVNGAYETLIDWNSSTAIKTDPGETNRVRVVCSGSSLELYANGQLLFVSQDTSLATGGFALQAGSYDVDNNPVSVAFDNLMVVNYP